MFFKRTKVRARREFSGRAWPEYLKLEFESQHREGGEEAGEKSKGREEEGGRPEKRERGDGESEGKKGKEGERKRRGETGKERREGEKEGRTTKWVGKDGGREGRILHLKNRSYYE